MQHPKQVKYTILGIQSKLVGKNKKTQIIKKRKINQSNNLKLIQMLKLKKRMSIGAYKCI